ncbi:MAG: hypothetical protein KBT39_01050 [Bacteroidales bacterium]|nr:hypothetical protein [Bacteroidales bacterium]
MKKIYMTPASKCVELTEADSLLVVSYTDSDDTDISGIDINTDPAEGGDGQLVKGESLWDEEW